MSTSLTYVTKHKLTKGHLFSYQSAFCSVPLNYVKKKQGTPRQGIQQMIDEVFRSLGINTSPYIDSSIVLGCDSIEKENRYKSPSTLNEVTFELDGERKRRRSVHLDLDEPSPLRCSLLLVGDSGKGHGSDVIMGAEGGGMRRNHIVQPLGI